MHYSHQMRAIPKIAGVGRQIAVNDGKSILESGSSAFQQLTVPVGFFKTIHASGSAIIENNGLSAWQADAMCRIPHGAVESVTCCK